MRKIYSCITLKSELEAAMKKFGCADEITFLADKLHSDPKEMNRVLQRIIDENAAADEIIIFVSGCGRATLDLKAATCDLIIPRTMDCIDILLSGGEKRPEGAIFVSEGWLLHMKNSALDVDRLTAKIGAEKAKDYLRKVYKGFSEFYIIDTGCSDLQSVEDYITPLVEILGGKIHYIKGKYAIIEKIISGDYDDKDIITIKKDGSVKIDEFAGLRPAVIK